MRVPITGCCGWTEGQGSYVTHFPVIELQTPFYQPPAISVVKKWKSLAPPGFHYCVKAWQLITHTPASPTYRRLKAEIAPSERELYGSFRPTEQVALAWERTMEIAAILDARVIVFQCPASFLPTREHIRNMESFFQGIERSGRLMAWEPRGADWTDELVRDLCKGNNLVHCVDPFQRMPAFGDALYWRLHGRGGYRYTYSDEELVELEGKLRDYAELPGPQYVLFNNSTSKQDALRFRRLCGETTE